MTVADSNRLRANTEADFWSKVDVRGPDECWPWKSKSVYKRGYGRFSMKGVERAAHRWAFFFTYGYWPKPQGNHTCDNPPCCNPAHTYAGTQKQNIQDAIARKRLRPARGASAGKAKLVDSDVIRIRALREKGQSRASIAKMYNLNVHTVSAITERKLWTHI